MISYRIKNDAWHSQDGRKTPINQMGDRHLDNTINFIVRSMGPIHMMYEMGRLLVPDPKDLDYGEHASMWRSLLILQREREHRNEHSIKIPDLD